MREYIFSLAPYSRVKQASLLPLPIIFASRIYACAVLDGETGDLV